MRVFAGLFVALLCCVSVGAQHTDYATLVNPFIGTGGHGHTFPGSTVPFGMVQLSPDTRIDQSWDGCGGYHYSDSLIYGFSHTHLSGTGCTDYGDVMLMPSVGKAEVEPLKYASSFSHKNEKAEAGYYSVRLDKNNILAELTSTTRTGYHRYTYPEKSEKWVILDLNHRDKLLEGKIEKVGDRAIRGYRRSAAWATDQLVYFYMEFSEPILEMADENLTGVTGRYGSTLKRSVQLKFAKGAKPLEVKVSLSSVDEEAAKNNLVSEIPKWDMAAVKKAAHEAWNKALSKIEVKGGTKDQQAIFYTALYHCMTQPNTYNDVDGRYRGRDKNIHQETAGHNYYTVFSLWDTFRGLHPLMNLIDPERTADFINTFIAQYKQGGRLPVWELSCNETECMIGYHAVPVICEAMMKDVPGFNYNEAYEACRHSALMDHFGLDAYKKKGFIETDDEHESVSKTLEYAYDDWCLSQMAAKLGYYDDFQLFSKRSYSWVNLFDQKSGHMRPRYNGGWLVPFDPRQVDNNFTEANSWQYSFFVPHHLPELVNANGGIKKFGERLDELFTTSSKTTGREQSDITGLIGQYAHGNEPSHHMAYLYSLIWQAPKAQERIRYIMDNFYKNDPDGLIGNEDCGQMSAWLVWSAMGMYSVCPGKSYYTIGTPLFPEVKINFDNGKTFVIKAEQSGPSNYYIQKALLNGKPVEKPVIQYADITSGGKLEYTMGNVPGKIWQLPDKDTTDDGDAWKFTQSPLLIADRQVFRDSLKVKLHSTEAIKVKITETWNTGAETSAEYRVSKGDTSIVTGNSRDGKTLLKTEINAVNTRNGEEGLGTSSVYYKIPNNWKITLKETFNPQYTAGGPEGLIDGLRGDVNWRKGRWQGYQEKDLVAEIDLMSVRELDTIGGSFLQDQGAWIVMPKELQVESSEDGKTWTAYEPVPQTKVNVRDEKVQTTELLLIRPVKARYLRIRGVNYGKLPAGHLSEGQPAFVFADELMIN